MPGLPPLPDSQPGHYPTVAVIPTADRRHDLLPKLLEELGDDADAIYVFDNSGLGDASWHVPKNENIQVLPAYNMGLYEMWNAGWIKAHANYDAFNLAFLNDDISVPPKFLTTLGDALRDPEFLDTWATYPDYTVSAAGSSPTGGVSHTEGTFRHGGMSGFAFMIKGELLRRGLQLVDERFHWWFGDDDLAFQITDHGGRIARVTGLGIDHIGGASAHRSDVQGLIQQDLALANEKWGQR